VADNGSGDRNSSGIVENDDDEEETAAGFGG